MSFIWKWFLQHTFYETFNVLFRSIFTNLILYETNPILLICAYLHRNRLEVKFSVDHHQCSNEILHETILFLFYCRGPYVIYFHLRFQNWKQIFNLIVSNECLLSMAKSKWNPVSVKMFLFYEYTVYIDIQNEVMAINHFYAKAINPNGICRDKIISLLSHRKYWKIRCTKIFWRH